MVKEKEIGKWEEGQTQQGCIIWGANAMIEITGLADTKSWLNLHTTSPPIFSPFLYNPLPHRPYTPKPPYTFQNLFNLFLTLFSHHNLPPIWVNTKFFFKGKRVCCTTVSLEMMVETEDLGLSLSLNFPQNTPNPHHVSSSTTYSSSPSGCNPQKPSWNEAFTSSGMFIFWSPRWLFPHGSLFCMVWCSRSAQVSVFVFLLLPILSSSTLTKIVVFFFHKTI